MFYQSQYAVYIIVSYLIVISGLVYFILSSYFKSKAVQRKLMAMHDVAHGE